MNAEHSEENVQVKAHAYVQYIDEWIEFKWKIWCGLSIFSNTKKLKNCNKKAKSYKN